MYPKLLLNQRSQAHGLDQSDDLDIVAKYIHKRMMTRDVVVMSMNMIIGHFGSHLDVPFPLTRYIA